MTPLGPLAALRPLEPMHPLFMSAYCPDGNCAGSPGGDFTSSGSFDPNQGFGYMPAPSGGPQVGVDFPGGGGGTQCDPGIDPNCGFPTGTTVTTAGAGSSTQTTSKSTGSGCSLFNPWPCLERLAAFLLGLICIIGGIYLYKPSLITTPVKTATKAATAAAAAA